MLSNQLLSFCPKCGCREFELKEFNENSKPVIAINCDNCGYIAGLQEHYTPNEKDNMVAKLEKYLDSKFQVVAMN